jgi:hypothetical protein
MSCASSGHLTKLKQSIFAPFDIYGCTFVHLWGIGVDLVIGKDQTLSCLECCV